MWPSASAEVIGSVVPAVENILQGYQQHNHLQQLKQQQLLLHQLKRKQLNQKQLLLQQLLLQQLKQKQLLLQQVKSVKKQLLLQQLQQLKQLNSEHK